MAKRGIVIVNTGSPAAPTPEAVRAYLRDFLSDPRICPINPLCWKLILNAFILPKRSVASAQKYASIWTPDGSPLTLIMGLLASRLQSVLDVADGGQSVVRCAMSYGAPSLEEAVEELYEAGVEELVVMPLYPQSAFSTTMVVRDKVEELILKRECRLSVCIVEHYAECDAYIEAIARSIHASGFDPSRDKVLFAFHSIPMKDIEAGDTYPDQVFSSATAIAARVGALEGCWSVGFQCRFDKSRRWLGPYIVESMEHLYDNVRPGQGRLFVVAPNFSIDCLETLFDIEVELRQTFFQRYPDAKKEDFVYVPCLNDSDDQVALLTSLISA